MWLYSTSLIILPSWIILIYNEYNDVIMGTMFLLLRVVPGVVLIVIRLAYGFIFFHRSIVGLNCLIEYSQLQALETLLSSSRVNMIIWLNIYDT